MTTPSCVCVTLKNRCEEAFKGSMVGMWVEKAATECAVAQWYLIYPPELSSFLADPSLAYDTEQGIKMLLGPVPAIRLASSTWS